MQRPDYHARGLANLMTSLRLAWGGEEGPYAPLPELPPERLRGRPVVLLLIDGLGDCFLGRQPPGRFHRHRIGSLGSVYPSATASAITTIGTGLAPQQHAITGWFTYFRELAAVAVTLPFRPRYGGETFARAAILPEDLIGSRAFSTSLATPCHVVSPTHIVDSDYSRATGGTAAREGYRDLGEFFARVGNLVAQGGSRYIFGYWTELDAICHRFGTDSPEAAAHFAQIETAFGAFIDSITGTGALILVTADHGLIDAPGDRFLSLADHPRLADCLTLPLCGEPRAPFCYVRARKRESFLAYVRDELAPYCRLMESDQLVEEGFFGLGEPHPELWHRIGDYALVMSENYALHDRLPHEKPFRLIGVHGGLSDEEMRVPLVVVEV